MEVGGLNFPLPFLISFRLFVLYSIAKYIKITQCCEFFFYCFCSFPLPTDFPAPFTHGFLPPVPLPAARVRYQGTPRYITATLTFLCYLLYMIHNYISCFKNSLSSPPHQSSLIRNSCQLWHVLTRGILLRYKIYMLRLSLARLGL